MTTFRAIVFDDNEIICQLFDIILSELGYKCDFYTEYDDTINALEQNQYDVCFIDWEVFDDQAVDVVDLIKLIPAAKRPKIFAVMSYLSAGEIVNAKQKGVLDCMAKPFNHNSIRELLDSYKKQIRTA